MYKINDFTFISFAIWKSNKQILPSEEIIQLSIITFKTLS